MTPDPENLPNDLTLCHGIIRELVEQHKQSQSMIAKMQHQLEQLLKARYGPRADRIDPNQKLLFAQELLKTLGPQGIEREEEQSTEPPAPSKKKQPGHGRKPFPDHLPRERVLYDVDPEEKVCRACEKEKVCIGEEVSEQLDYVPASLKVIQHVRLTYACPAECEGEVVTASKPLQAIEKGVPGPGLLAQVVTSKYGDHLPLYRQENIFKRHGMEIPRSTQCDWMRVCADLLMPVYDKMKERILSSNKIHTDDTPVPVLDKTKTKTKQGRLWVYIGDARNPYILYDYTASRKRDGPVKFLGSYTGFLQADAYGGYDGIYAGGKVQEVACWAHARRKFVEAQTSNPQAAITATAWIKLLYEVEKEARKWRDSLSKEINPLDRHRLFVNKRRMLRQEKSKATLNDFKVWLEEKKRTLLPKSPFRQAVNYALNNWEALNQYVDNGELEMDNNIAERAVKCVAIGRKNWMFAGSDRGGKTAAVLYSFVSTCKDHGIDPFAYLRDVFTRISAHPMSKIDEFLPDRWKSLQENNIPVA